jgi:hypothetical protein
MPASISRADQRSGPLAAVTLATSPTASRPSACSTWYCTPVWKLAKRCGLS